MGEGTVTGEAPVFDEGYAIDNATQQSATETSPGEPGAIDVHLSTYLRHTLPAGTPLKVVEAHVVGLLKRAAAAVPELQFGYCVEFETEPDVDVEIDIDIDADKDGE